MLQMWFFHFWSSKSKHLNLLYGIQKTLACEKSINEVSSYCKVFEQVFLLANTVSLGCGFCLKLSSIATFEVEFPLTNGLRLLIC